MLYVYHSNCMERLRDRLLEVTEPPLTDTLAPETIIVPHAGMARWLSIEWAHRRGIAANLSFPFPAAFFWQLFESALDGVPRQPPFRQDALTWHLMELLPGWADRPGFEAPGRYLQGDSLKTYQLAQRMAGLYEQYLVYRPDWIRAWEAGDGDHWQAQLWRALAQRIAEPHRARLLSRFVEQCERGDVATDGWPERFSVFAVSALPPVYLQVLSCAASFVPVHLFVLNPSVAYWGDVVGERELARLRARWRRSGLPDVSEYYSEGHPLLAASGRLCREFLEALHAHPCADEELFERRDPCHALACLQDDMLLLQARSHGSEEAPPWSLERGDESIRIHACHSPMREVEVLHDQLLSMFAADSSLRPHDVVVMMPRVDDYAPYIEAVFDAVPEQRFIPWAIADRTLSRIHPLIEVFLQLLQLPASRFKASEVLALLEVPALRRGLRLEEAAVERLRDWVRGSGIRWGRDAQARALTGVGAVDDNTWRFGIDRLLLGYAMPAARPGQERLFRGRLPYDDIEGSEAAWLGQLESFLDWLERRRARLSQPRPPAEWTALLQELLEPFDAVDEDEVQALQIVRDAIDQVVDSAAQAGFEGPVDPAVVREMLAERLGAGDGGHRFLGGQVTFCAMMPMRSIPFRVVCLLGMNESDFPRRERPLGFDLMARARRVGDRSRRDEDHGIFLEAILCARDRLHLSYVGRSQRDNAERLPSVLVSELMDTIDRGFRAEGEERASRLLFTEHRLQPFAAAYYAADVPELFSYADEWLAGARALHEETHMPPFVPEALPPPREAPADVALTELLRFFRNPARAFLRQRLGVYLDEAEEEVEDREPFAPDGLDAYGQRQFLLERLLAGDPPGQCRALMRAGGRLPVGAFGDQVFDDWLREAQDMEAKLAQWRTGPREPLPVHLDIDGCLLHGQVGGLFEGGLLRYRPGKLKEADRWLLWIEHLVLNACAGPAPSRHQATDRQAELEPATAEAAREQLSALIDAWRLGLREPLPLFPQASYVYAREVAAGASAEQALEKVRKSWSGDKRSRGEGDDPYVRTAFRGRDPLAGDFDHWARTLAGPLLGATRGKA